MLKVVPAILILLLLTSCNIFYTKESYIKNFDTFIQKVKIENNKYSAKDWAKADLQYNKFAEQDYMRFRDNLTEADKVELGKLKAAYSILKFKKGTKDVLENAKDMLYQVKGVLNEVKDSL